MAKHGKLLIADDNRNILQALMLFLPFEFESVHTVTSTTNMLQEIEKNNIDVVLLDMNFKAGQQTGNEGIFWLREIKKRFPEVEVVMLTAYGDVNLAVTALKEGAADFVLKPWDNDKLTATIKAAMRLRNSVKEISELRQKEKLLRNELKQPGSLAAMPSAAMKQVYQLVSKVAATDANILITGENGTGKEVIARDIHRLSARKNELFVLADLSALPESLFESELFGYKKGAFTDAADDRPGKFSTASRGTLFLDEIGNIPLHLQSKLLTVLQTRTVTPLGAVKPEAVDIRLICATNKPLSQMVYSGEFRQDLLYRINTIQIHIPPLRERIEDISILANHFLGVYGKKYGKPDITLSGEALKSLENYSWPGNIRELQHTIEKGVILCEQKELMPGDFMLEYHSEKVVPETLDDMEKMMISGALLKYGGNYSVVASKLGITRPTLYSKIKKYGL